jgi:ABC-type lipoprotein release transport system permease subunit
MPAALRLAWPSFVRRRWGLLLIVAPTTVLFAMVGLLFQVEHSVGMLGESEADYRNLRVGAPYENLFYTNSEVQRMAALPMVKAVGYATSRVGYTAETGTQTPAFLNIVNSAYMRMWSCETPIPDNELQRWDEVKNGVIVPRAVAVRHGWKVGDTINVPLRDGKPTQLVITYIYSGGTRESDLSIHPAYLDGLLGEPQKFWVVWLEVDDREHIDQVVQELRELFPGRPLIISTMVAMKKFLYGQSAVLVDLFRATGVLAMVLLVIVSITILGQSLQERLRYLATLRTMGYRRSTLRRMVLIESLLLLLPGALLGAVGPLLYFGSSGFDLGTLLEVHMTPRPVLLTWAVALAIGLASAIPSAIRVTTMDVLETLRGG